MHKFKQELEETLLLLSIVEKKQEALLIDIIPNNILFRDTELFLRFAKQECLKLSVDEPIPGTFVAGANVKGFYLHVIFNQRDYEYLGKEGLLP